jgi:hypothetical protein
VNEPIIEAGTIVLHPNRPDWGPGKALSVGGGGQVTVYFRDFEEKKVGDAVKTLATKFVALEVAADQSDPMLDSLPPFTKGKFEGVRKPRLSLDHAVRALIDAHPDAFGGPDYVEKVRASAMAAHEKWVESLGDGQGVGLLDDGKIDDVRQLVTEIGSNAGLLTPDERRTVEAVLDDGDVAESYLKALFEVVGEGAPEQTSFQRLIDVVEDYWEQEDGPKGSTWPMLTLFPFIACPGDHILLRPPVYQKCAARLNFELRGTAGLNWFSYERSLKLAKVLLARVKPLGAKDFIDVQTMIKVISTA